MNSLKQTLSSLSSDPLFSTITTFYMLILLYFPTLFLKIILSPVLNPTIILFLTLLRLGAIQRKQPQPQNTILDAPDYCQYSVLEELTHPTLPSKISEADTEFCTDDAEFQTIDPQVENEKSYYCSKTSSHQQLQQTHEFPDESHEWVSMKSNLESESEAGSCQNLDTSPSHFRVDSFLEWDVRAPLEVIYEEYEGEKDENGDVLEEKRENHLMGIEKYASLSLFYPDTDESDTSSDFDCRVDGAWESPENMGLKLGEEERDGMIEIELDGKKENEALFFGEEENLIEIDIFPARNDAFPGEFSGCRCGV